MNINRILSVALLVFVVTRVSEASYGVTLRFLMEEAKGSEKPTSQKISPPPTSLPLAKGDPSSQKSPPLKDQSPPDGGKPNSGSPSVPPKPSNRPTVLPPMGPEGKSPQGPASEGHGKKNESPNSEATKGPIGSGSPSVKTQEESCNGTTSHCQVEGLIACLLYPENDRKEFSLLVRNGGENDLIVNITATSNKLDVKMLNLTKHNVTKINFSADATDSLKIVLNAGKGDCDLALLPKWNPFQRFSAYAPQLTPIYGAYFLFLVIFVVGGTWACCKFGRRGRRADAGVPYQQLEMGAQRQSSSAVVETSTADGWDQGWDDDWDEEEAVRPSNKQHPTGSVSSNGLSSRSNNKQRWDDDWDD